MQVLLTIFTAAEEIEQVGAAYPILKMEMLSPPLDIDQVVWYYSCLHYRKIPIVCDIRYEEQVEAAVLEKKHFDQYAIEDKVFWWY